MRIGGADWLRSKEGVNFDHSKRKAATMDGTMIVSGKQAGKKKALFEDFSVPVPPGVEGRDGGGGGGLTLRELITRIVVGEVEAFRNRQEKRRLTRVLSEREVAEGAEKGKIDSGGADERVLAQKVNEEEAIGTALQAFEYGLYLVIIDGVEQRDLEARVYVRPGSRITFVRLVFLAGA